PYGVWMGKKMVGSIVEGVGSSTAVNLRVKESQLTLSLDPKPVSEPTIAMCGPRLVSPCPPAFSQGRTVKSVLGSNPTRATVRPELFRVPTNTCAETAETPGMADMPRPSVPLSSMYLGLRYTSCAVVLVGAMK